MRSSCRSRVIEFGRVGRVGHQVMISILMHGPWSPRRARAPRRGGVNGSIASWLLLKRPARSASLVPLGAPHPLCCPVSLALLLHCMHASACSPLRSTAAMRALCAGVPPLMLVGWPAAKSVRRGGRSWVARRAVLGRFPAAGHPKAVFSSRWEVRPAASAHNVKSDR